MGTGSLWLLLCACFTSEKRPLPSRAVLFLCSTPVSHQKWKTDFGSVRALLKSNKSYQWLHTREFGLVGFLLQHKLTRCQMNIATPFLSHAHEIRNRERGLLLQLSKAVWRVSPAQLLLWDGRSLYPDCHLVRTFPHSVTHASPDLTVLSPPTDHMHNLGVLAWVWSIRQEESALSAAVSLHAALPWRWKELNSLPPLSTQNAEWKSENCQNANRGRKKITRSRWDKMDIFHLSRETLQYIICDA